LTKNIAQQTHLCYWG